MPRGEEAAPSQPISPRTCPFHMRGFSPNFFFKVESMETIGCGVGLRVSSGHCFATPQWQKSHHLVRSQYRPPEVRWGECMDAWKPQQAHRLGEKLGGPKMAAHHPITPANFLA